LVASVLPLVSQVASGAPARLSVPRGPLLLSLAVQSAWIGGAEIVSDERRALRALHGLLATPGCYLRAALPDPCASKVHLRSRLRPVTRYWFACRSQRRRRIRVDRRVQYGRATGAAGGLQIGFGYF
jgi:hypothetical protein